MKQEFHVILKIRCDIESGDKPYLTEARVKSQITKFLRNRSMSEGLPCHGTSEIVVVEVIEDKIK